MIRTALLASLALSSPALAEDCLDRSLVLLADVSSSMDVAEKAVQREGYAAAFRHGDVISAIVNGYCGRIAVTYIEFASDPHPVVDWQIIETDEDAEAFAQAIEAAGPSHAKDQGALTGMARALAYAGAAFDRLGMTADRNVIDISSDGPDNVTQNVAQVRDELITPTAENGWREITINGLIVGGGHYGLTPEQFEAYFADNVIGGPGHFLKKARDANHLPEIVRSKLAQEIG